MNKKTRRVEIRLTESEYKKLRDLTKQSSRTMSNLLRDQIGKVKVNNSEIERQRNINLNRINANLNMIAKWVNTYKDSADSLKVIELLINIERQVKEL